LPAPGLVNDPSARPLASSNSSAEGVPSARAAGRPFGSQRRSCSGLPEAVKMTDGAGRIRDQRDRMKGSVRFHYDEENDVHYVYPKWYVETEDDCRLWHSQFEAYFSRFGRKVDVVIVLDDFKIGPKIGTIWGQYRADWINRFTRYSVRVRQEARASTFAATSAAKFGGGFEEAPTVEVAIAQIKARRLAEGEAG
jgi:hypothetical protein